jgi:RNA recognition motif-containing protein
LKDLTRKFTGKVERAEVYCHEDGHSKGFGYVSVRGHEAANVILGKLIHLTTPWPRWLSTPKGKETLTDRSGQLDGYDFNGRKLKAKIGSIPQARKASECLSDTPVPTNWDRILSGTTSPGNSSPALSHASHFTHNTDATLVAGSSSSSHSANNYNHNHNHYHSHSQNFDHNPNLNPSAAIYTLSPHSQLPVNIANGVVEIEPRGIFIGNVPFNTTWMELKDHLRSAGNILRCDVPHFADGKPRGYAVALFETPEEAKEAVALFDGTPFSGRPLRVRLDRFCETKNPRTPKTH